MERIIGAIAVGIAAGIGAWFATRRVSVSVSTIVVFTLIFYIFWDKINKKES